MQEEHRTLALPYLDDAIVKRHISHPEHEYRNIFGVLKRETLHDGLGLYFKIVVIGKRNSLRRASAERAVVFRAAVVATLHRRVLSRPQRIGSIDTADIRRIQKPHFKDSIGTQLENFFGKRVLGHDDEAQISQVRVAWLTVRNNDGGLCGSHGHLFHWCGCDGSSHGRRRFVARHWCRSGGRRRGSRGCHRCGGCAAIILLGDNHYRTSNQGKDNNASKREHAYG
jgi:hypothetical protein